MAALHVVCLDLQSRHGHHACPLPQHDGPAQLIRVGQLRHLGDLDAPLEDRLALVRDDVALLLPGDAVGRAVQDVGVQVQRLPLPGQSDAVQRAVGLRLGQRDVRIDAADSGARLQHGHIVRAPSAYGCAEHLDVPGVQRQLLSVCVHQLGAPRHLQAGVAVHHSRLADQRNSSIVGGSRRAVLPNKQCEEGLLQLQRRALAQ
mmetsp:Transcript_16506/g.36578  ORF Transcript_16506/g.36578 Transcript_16506/m.36578 type:complete len:203 (+) Transcript_16506:315-923(+)